MLRRADKQAQRQEAYAGRQAKADRGKAGEGRGGGMRTRDVCLYQNIEQATLIACREIRSNEHDNENDYYSERGNSTQLPLPAA